MASKRPQNGHPLRHQQQSGLQPFVPGSAQPLSFDSPNYFTGLDPTAAAKQMAALNEAGKVRLANSRVAGFGSSPAPFPNATSFTQSNDPSLAIGQDGTILAGNQSQFQLPNQSYPQFVNPSINPSLVDPSMSQSNVAIRQQNNPSNAQTLHQRQRFLTSLANVMAKRGTPLPPALTGVPSQYDPNNSMWRALDLSPGNVGCFRLAGKDVDLFKLWASVYQVGGGAKLNNENNWHILLPVFELPEQMPGPQGASVSVAFTLAKHYMALLHPFEDFYKQNTQSKAASNRLLQSGQLPRSRQAGSAGPSQQGFPAPAGQMGGNLAGNLPGLTSVPNTVGLAAGTLQNVSPQPPLPHHQQPMPSPVHSQYSGRESLPPSGVPPPVGLLTGMPDPPTDKNLHNQDEMILKRKIDGEDEARRSRQKTDLPEGRPITPPGADGSIPPPSLSATVSTSNAPLSAPRPRAQPSRRKIEYIPLAREVDTYGGRDLKLIEAELTRMTRHRQLRDPNEWGTIDIDSMCMSIRSRLPNELSYALTILTLLSTMRGQAPGSGFPIMQCPDLLEEVLDLVEDEAFGNDDPFEPPIDADTRITTHRELVTILHEAGTQLFASSPRREDAAAGPRQRPAYLILMVLNIVHNLAQIPDNVLYLAKQERLLDLSLRLCSVTRDDAGVPRSISPSLPLADLVVVRKLVLETLATLAAAIQLNGSSSKTALRMAKRAFELVSSYLIDPVEALSPIGCAQLTGVPLTSHCKPPLFPDVALDLFTRLSVTDVNRQVFAKAVPLTWLWQLFESLVRRLPVAEVDFQLVSREAWLSYLEKVVMSLYSISFLAPPAFKERVKAQHNLGFTKIMLRMIQRFLLTPVQGGGPMFIVCVRRAIETMKMIDDCGDSFDAPQSVAPTMTFGMGWDEVGDHSIEKGTGLLGGYRGVAWDLLMIRELDTDHVMFSELESLARVG